MPHLAICQHAIVGGRKHQVQTGTNLGSCPVVVAPEAAGLTYQGPCLSRGALNCPLLCSLVSCFDPISFFWSQIILQISGGLALSLAAPVNGGQHLQRTPQRLDHMNSSSFFRLHINICLETDFLGKNLMSRIQQYFQFIGVRYTNLCVKHTERTV